VAHQRGLALAADAVEHEHPVGVRPGRRVEGAQEQGDRLLAVGELPSGAEPSAVRRGERCGHRHLRWGWHLFVPLPGDLIQGG
jgi:hypothetical protein